MYHWTANCSITVNRRFGVSLRPSTREVDVQEAGGGKHWEGEEGFLPGPQRLRAVCGMSKQRGRWTRMHACAHIRVLFANAWGGSEVCFVPRRVVHALQHSPHHLLQVLARSLLLLQRPFHLLVVLPGRNNLCTTAFWWGLRGITSQ